jgi:ribonuclease PH
MRSITTAPSAANRVHPQPLHAFQMGQESAAAPRWFWLSGPPPVFPGKDTSMSSHVREADELRPVHFELGFVRHPEGSVLISMGDTKVLCNATVENRLPPWLRYGKEKHGWVTAEYAMLPRSTTDRSPRETLRPKGRTQEIQRLIARSLRAVVDLDKLGERQIIVDCDVLQADGGTRTASITGGYVALALAIRDLERTNQVEAGVLKQAVAAVSVGIVNGKAILDLDYSLDLAAEVDMNVVKTEDGRFVEVQGTAEGEPYDRAALNAMLVLADMGIKQLLRAQKAALGEADG